MISSTILNGLVPSVMYLVSVVINFPEENAKHGMAGLASLPLGCSLKDRVTLA